MKESCFLEAGPHGLNTYLKEALHEAFRLRTDMDWTDKQIVSLFGTQTSFSASALNLPKPPQSLLIVLCPVQNTLEGPYLCGDCGRMQVSFRPAEQFLSKRWEVFCPICGEMMLPCPHTLDAESSPFQDHAAVVITLSLLHPFWPTPDFLEQEEGSFLSVFSRVLLQDESPVLHEDGNQMRDTLYAKDLLTILCSLLENPPRQSGVYTLASGTPQTIFKHFTMLQEVFGKEHLDCQFSGTYRAHDIRHNLADIEPAQRELGFSPAYSWESALADFAQTLLGKSTRASSAS